jgi:hypothetical protein
MGSFSGLPIAEKQESLPTVDIISNKVSGNLELLTSERV